jgi:hypothetical protein
MGQDNFRFLLELVRNDMQQINIAMRVIISSDDRHMALRARSYIRKTVYTVLIKDLSGATLAPLSVLKKSRWRRT